MNHLHDIPNHSYSAIDAAQDRQYTGHTGYVNENNENNKNKTTSPYVISPSVHRSIGASDVDKSKINNAVTMLKSTGTKEEMVKEANIYADSVGMNPANRDLLVTLKTEGPSAMIKKAFEDPHEQGRTMTYAEMRSMYG